MATVTALHPGFAADIQIDLSEALSKNGARTIRAAFRKFPVLVFREQNETPFDRMADIAGLFGRPGPCGDITNLHPDGTIVDPESLDARYTRGNLLWHMDMLVLETPPLAAMLFGKELPVSGGGQTQFANLEAAFAKLAEKTKRKLESTFAVHTLEIIRKRMGITAPAEIQSEYPPGRHPVVCIDPVSRTPTLLFGAHTSHLEGYSSEASDDLLAELSELATVDGNVYTHSWAQNDLVLWSNRRTMHRVLPYSHTHERRRLWRMEVLTQARPVAARSRRWQRFLPW